MKTKKLLPGSTIGIIGGGQLAYYMAIEAKNMGYKVSVYDPNPDASAGSIANHTIKDFDDVDALIEFAQSCDVLTYEFENMNLENIEILDKDFNLPQGSKMLLHTAHRYEEIKMAQSLGIPTVRSVYLKDANSDRSELSNLRLPLIAKTCRFGYDGKGQQKLNEVTDLVISDETLVSEFISFEKEVSVIIVRSEFGVYAYPCIENVHKEGILYTSTTLDKDAYPLAKEYAERIAIEMNYIGVMAVEFFVHNDELIFNEVAPRPHNSGHLTLTVSNKSQFKSHIEAICGLNPGALFHYEDATMLNVLGQNFLKARTLIGTPNTYHYEYGKTEIVHNRKMGHIVFTQNTKEIQNYKRELNT